MKNYDANVANTWAFVSGIRTKIGYAITLKLLRNNGRVIGTSRYPNLTLEVYKREYDYDKWKSNLIIIGCDFTDFSQVNNMIDVLQKYPINILINNAAQTYRHTQEYYDTVNVIESTLKLEDSSNINKSKLPNTDMSIVLASFNTNHDIIEYVTPLTTSWGATIDKIHKDEILEAVMINQLVPTLIVQKLLPIMTNPKFVINVTANEGQFYGKKTDKHVHVNMCKAAMNMMIRTLSETDDSNLNVFCIDPGFVSGINSYSTFPLDMYDGASRVLHPIFSYYNDTPLDKKQVKLKNYISCKW